MKVFLFILAFFLVQHTSCYAQHQKGSVFLSARMGHLEIQDFGPRVYGGLELEFMVRDRIGIHYSLLLGKNYFHMPLGPVAGVFTGIAVGLFAYKSDSTKTGVGLGVIVGLLTAIIPEGISYTIPLSKRSYLAPYISPLQFEYLKTDGGQDAFAGGGLGLRFHQYVKSGKLRFSPYFEYKIHYNKNPHPGFSTGLNFSFCFAGSKNK